MSMSAGSVNAFHLSLMNKYLPASMGLLLRGKNGGMSRIFESVTSLESSFGDLCAEGELNAKAVRERLDEIYPGLGNPVMEVIITEDSNNESCGKDSIEDDVLKDSLERINSRINLLEKVLQSQNQISR